MGWGGGGWLQNGRGGEVKIYPYKREGGGRFSHTDGGGGRKFPLFNNSKEGGGAGA